MVLAHGLCKNNEGLLERKYFKMFPKIIIEFDVNSVLSVGRIRTQMGGILVLIT